MLDTPAKLRVGLPWTRLRILAPMLTLLACGGSDSRRGLVDASQLNTHDGGDDGAGPPDAEDAGDAGDAEDAEDAQEADAAAEAADAAAEAADAGQDAASEDAGGSDGDGATTPTGCSGDDGCPGAHCVERMCVRGPTAGFTLSTGAGVLPLLVQATSSAVAGDAPIVSTRYDFTGAGFGASESHRYLEAGDFDVRQEVRDANGFIDTSSLGVSVTGFAPVRFSATDHGPLVFLSPDRLSVENRGEDRGGARSDDVVQPGSGVFYFEAARLIEPTGVWGVGLGTAMAALDTQIGTSAESLGLDTSGDFGSTGATCTGATNFDRTKHDYGFVIDYRGTNPRIHIVLEDDDHKATVRRSCVMATTAPLYILYAGVRYQVGYQLKLNTGSDLTNLPLHFPAADLRAALTNAGASDAAAALVPGFGRSRSPAPEAAPVLTPVADQMLPVGTTVHLAATASDVEDGDLSSAIIWTDVSSQHHAPLTGAGGEFSFTPNSVGRHPISVSVTDWDGVTTQQLVMITTTGTLPQQPTEVAFASAPGDPLIGQGIVVSPDGLSVRFEGNGKYGIRANQAIYGQYWYFEGHRGSSHPENMGIGIIIPDGSLNPYDFVNVPWSCSINLLDSTWRNLISQRAWNTQLTDYGFAVDYRGLHPIVHLILGGAYHSTITMDDVWGPVHPMVYGDPPNARTSTWDVTINFGASAFQFDPRTILSGSGIDITGLELGWGDVNTP